MLGIFKKLGTRKKSGKKRAMVYVDFEHWYISLEKLFGEKPDVKAFRKELAERYDIVDIAFFGDFSNPSLRGEIHNIRMITSTIIETQNSSPNFEKDFTDFIILDHTFNIANIDAGDFDMLFRAVLFCVELNDNSINQHFRPNGVESGFETPITVDGNKVTLHMSAADPAYRDVDMYMFQDKDDTQLHMYMHTDAFINYFANMELYNLLASGEITSDNTAAIEKVFADMEERVESINVSFVLKARE